MKHAREEWRTTQACCDIRTLVFLDETWTATRTVEGLRTEIGTILNALTPQECNRYFAAAGYVNT